MELRRPIPTGTTSKASDDLQHAAAMRVQARIEAETQRAARLARAKAFKGYFSALLLLCVFLLGLWAWRSGLLDSVLGKGGAEEQKSLGNLFTAPATSESHQAGAKGVAEKILGHAAKVVEDVKTSLPEKLAGKSPAPSWAERFAGASVDYWKNAVAEDKPGKSRALTFTGLVPKAQGGFDLLEIGLGGGQFSAKRLNGAGGVEEITKAAFNKLIAQTPYLVVREGRAYFCSAGQTEQGAGFAVPAAGKSFNPAHEEFGALIACLAELKVAPPAFRYEVSLEIKRFKKTLPVATVGFGESVPRAAFEAAAGKLISDKEMVEMLLAEGRVQVNPVK